MAVKRVCCIFAAAVIILGCAAVDVGKVIDAFSD